MGFLERTRSLRRKETPPIVRKKQEDATTTTTTTTTQQVNDLNVGKDYQRPLKSAHSHKESTWKGPQVTSQDMSRPRTASKTTRDMYSQLPPPPSAKPPTDSRASKLSNGPSRKMSMTPSPRTDSPKLTLHANHSTPGVVLGNPRNPKRSMTTPTNVPQIPTKNEEVEVAPAKFETASAAPRKEPHLRKSKSGTWRSFFSRKQSKPPVPDFNPADIAPPPALPKGPLKDKDSAKGFSPVKLSPKELAPEVPIKDGKKLDRNSISVDKTRSVQKQTSNRAQFTKSMISPTTLPQLKLEHLSALEPPPRSTARSPSAESATTQYFDAASHSSGPSLPVTPLESSAQLRLDVKIPAVEMERYSVMFERLLKPQTSLMERRQTTVKQLNLPNQSAGGLAPESPALQRRATSPNLSIHTPVTAKMLEDGSQVATPVPIYRAGNAPRLLRSQTAPPGALNPSSSDFDEQNKAMSIANNSSTCSNNSPVWSDASQPQTPASDTETFVSFDVNDDDDDDSDDDDAEIVTYSAVAMQATTPFFKDPQWRNDTPIMSAPPIPPKAPGRSSPPAFDREEQAAMLSRPHPPRTSSLDDVAAKRKTRTGPQIGIARKVSVVRRPSPGRLSVPAPSPAKHQSLAVVDPNAPLPVFSKQPLRPKLVDVRNRRSTLVVLDQD